MSVRTFYIRFFDHGTTGDSRLFYDANAHRHIDGLDLDLKPVGGDDMPHFATWNGTLGTSALLVFSASMEYYSHRSAPRNDTLEIYMPAIPGAPIQRVFVGDTEYLKVAVVSAGMFLRKSLDAKWAKAREARVLA